jgi:hypothetical protein
MRAQRVKDAIGRPPSPVKRTSRGRSLNRRTVTLQLAYWPPFNWSLLATLLAFDPRVAFDELVSGLTRAADLDLASAHWGRCGPSGSQTPIPSIFSVNCIK